MLGTPRIPRSKLRVQRAGSGGGSGGVQEGVQQGGRRWGKRVGAQGAHRPEDEEKKDVELVEPLGQVRYRHRLQRVGLRVHPAVAVLVVGHGGLAKLVHHPVLPRHNLPGQTEA
eukprot:829333-Prorocentrum_minimum.AAC.1